MTIEQKEQISEILANLAEDLDRLRESTLSDRRKSVKTWTLENGTRLRQCSMALKTLSTMGQSVPAK